MSQGSEYPYCNTTTDLEMVYKDIEDFAGIDTLQNWVEVAGYDDVYASVNSGYYSLVYEDGAALTAKSNLTEVQQTVGSFWYNESVDTLYIHCSDGGDPNAHTITAVAQSWLNLKTKCRNDAMEEVESYLDPRYPRPLPFAKNSYNGAQYDGDLVKATALVTVRKIIEQRDPSNKLIEIFWRRVYSEEPPFGILYEYKSGKRAFSFETTVDDFSGRLENIALGEGSTGRIYLAGRAQAADRLIYRVKIDTAGAVETATYAISDDDGRTWISTYNKTYNQYTHSVAGVFIRFDGTFVLNDEWRIEIAGGPDSVNNTKISSIRMEFGL